MSQTGNTKQRKRPIKYVASCDTHNVLCCAAGPLPDDSILSSRHMTTPSTVYIPEDWLKCPHLETSFFVKRLVSAAFGNYVVNQEGGIKQRVREFGENNPGVREQPLWLRPHPAILIS